MILEAKNVSYFYKSNKEKLILDHVSYQFEEGKLYAVLGPSGSGKTTLLSLLAGLDTPTEGEILYAGIPVTAKDLTEHRRHHIALVFQSYNLIDYLTPVENVKLGGSGNPQALLTQLGIGKEYWKRSVLQLSGGQQQRVAPEPWQAMQKFFWQTNQLAIWMKLQPRSFIHNFAPEKSGEESRWLDGLRPDNTQLRMVRFDKVQNPLVLVCKVKFYINLFSLVNVNLFNQGNNNTAL